jgi:hypothetical protein
MARFIESQYRATDIPKAPKFSSPFSTFTKAQFVLVVTVTAQPKMRVFAGTRMSQSSV